MCGVFHLVIFTLQPVSRGELAAAATENMIWFGWILTLLPTTTISA
jgi:hypothetical protein